MKPPMDSTGKVVHVGDRVRFRGEVFTIKAIGPREGRFGTHQIIFEEEVTHTPEIPDEISIDLLP